jgi:methylated-DNA-[protein]-cysteine S-methyltransferase
MTNPFATFDPPLAGPPVLEPTDVSYVLEDTEVGRLLVAVRSDGRVVTCG